DEVSGNTAIVSLRLKIEDRKVTEAEWYLSRKGDSGIGTGAGAQANAAFWDPEYVAAHAPPDRVVRKSERISRNDLIAIANSYFDGPSAHDSKQIVAHPGCIRVENGVPTTQRDAPANTTPNTTRVHNGQTDCTFEGPMANI